MKKMVKAWIVLVLYVVLFCGCGKQGGHKMPFNGEVTFYEMTVTIPSDYIRDSVRSEDNVWIFECGNYNRYIMLFHDALEMQGGNTDPETYCNAMRRNGGDSEIITLQGNPCVYTTIVNNNGMFATEAMVFVNDTTYALTMCTTKEEDMKEYQSVYESLSFGK